MTRPLNYLVTLSHLGGLFSHSITRFTGQWNRGTPLVPSSVPHSSPGNNWADDSVGAIDPETDSRVYWRIRTWGPMESPCPLPDPYLSRRRRGGEGLLPSN